MTYSFAEQLKAGEVGEAALDTFFSRWFEVTPVSREEQREGIDRRFRELGPRGRVLTVEYKTDKTAARTNNAFVETVSVRPHGGRGEMKLGWAIRSRAEVLIYCIPEPQTIYVIQMARLRGQLERWQAVFPQRAIPNVGYETVGVLVPLGEFERIALQVY